MFRYFICLCFLLTSCSTTVKEETIHVVGQRWIDMNDVLEFVKYSESDGVVVKSTDVLNYLGEPVYIEKYNVDNTSNTLLWYLYKSKHYPILEKEAKQNLQLNWDEIPKTKESIEIKQIKPDKIADYNLWESSEKWLLIVVNDGYHEIIFTTMDSYEPKFKRELIFESKRFDKPLIKDLDPEAAKAILENN